MMADVEIQPQEDMQSLMARFPDAPVMAAGKFWPSRSGLVAASSGHRMGTLYAQDSSSRMHIQVRAGDGMTMFGFYVNTMLGLRFDLAGLSDADKRTWLDAVYGIFDKRHSGKGWDAVPVTLWTAARQERDYLICIFHPDRPFVHLHAFSAYNHEAAVRILYPTWEETVGWLEAQWFAP